MIYFKILKRSLLFLALSSLFIASCSDIFSTNEEPPELELPSRLTTFVEEEFTQAIIVDDPQGLEVEVTVNGLPEWLTFSPNENQLRGVPSETDAGLYQLEVEADNGTRFVTADLLIRVYRSDDELALQSKLNNAVNTTTSDLDGISIAIIDRNGDTFQAFNGTSGSGFGRSYIDQSSKFRIASITKPMTTAMILKLVEDGQLNLDGYVEEYYETELPNADSITIRQLLSHTGGVFDHLNSSSFWTDPSFSSTKVWTAEELIEFAVRNGGEFPPGESYKYSNTGFVVLGAIVEEITGMDLEDAYEKLLFEPMELSSTLYDNFSTESNTIPNLALNSRTYEYHLTAVGSAGAIAATPEDVARAGRYLYGGHYLSTELTEKLSDNIGESVGGADYGLGTRIWETGGIHHYGHTGGLMDYQSILMYIPEADITIAMHTHDSNSNWFTLVDDIFAYAVQNFSDELAKPEPFIHGAEPRDEIILDDAANFN